MPRITVTTGKPGHLMLLSERVTVEDFESGHFRAQLAERLAWAVGDADQVERAGDKAMRGATSSRLSPAAIRGGRARRRGRAGLSGGDVLRAGEFGLDGVAGGGLRPARGAQR
jgi:hypothetical protein